MRQYAHESSKMMLFLFTLFWYWPYLRRRSANPTPPPLRLRETETQRDPYSCAATAQRFADSLIDGPQAPVPWDTYDPRQTPAKQAVIVTPSLLLFRVLVAPFLLLLCCGDIESNPGPSQDLS
jgi:hypothetical protein